MVNTQLTFSLWLMAFLMSSAIIGLLVEGWTEVNLCNKAYEHKKDTQGIIQPANIINYTE